MRAEPATAARVTGRVAGKGIFVAGATGMAARAAERFAAEGARIFVTARTAADGKALAARIRHRGGDAEFHSADLREEGQVVAVFDAARERFGRLDGVFHVAGGSGRRFGDGPLHKLTLEGWEATFRLNLTTQFLVAREAIRTMLAQAPGPAGRGAILLMSSILGFHPAPSLFATHAYAAAKSAVVGFVGATAAYYAPAGIRINAVAPSLVTTPMSTRAADNPATVDYSRRRQPLLCGFMAPDDVAEAAVYLLADESRAVTGQVLKIDGGWSVSDGIEWAGPEAAG